MTSEKKHAVLSPSGAHRWSRCTSAPAMERHYPNEENEYSREGTAAHELADICLRSEGTRTLDAQPAGRARSYAGRKMSNGVEVTADMPEHINGYLDFITGYGKQGFTILPEQQVPISHVTTEPGADGTTDMAAVSDKLLGITDLKYGRKFVGAEENEQLLLYAAGVVKLLDGLYDFEEVEMNIYQPRCESGETVKTWRISIADFNERIAKLNAAAVEAWAIYNGSQPVAPTPGKKQCHWCKAKADCGAYHSLVRATVGVEFEDLNKEVIAEVVESSTVLNELGYKHDYVDMVEQWCKAIRAAAYTQLMAGKEVVGAEGPYKLVRGREGARKWEDEAAAEAALKAARLKVDDMYDKSIISPTAAEKLVKKELLSPKQWDKLQPLIVRKEGSLSVAPATSKSPAVQPQAIEFAAVDGANQPK